MGQYVALSLAQQTFALRLIAVFAALALTLALAGVHGVVSYVVDQRAREIGVRLALGATPASVRRLVLRDVLAAALVGVLSGVLALVASRDVLARLLFSVSPLDVNTTAVVGCLLIVGACAAAYVPIAKAALPIPRLCCGLSSGSAVTPTDPTARFAASSWPCPCPTH